MKIKEKKIYILNFLYKRKEDGKNHNIIEILKTIDVSEVVSYEIGRSLIEEGYARGIQNKSGIFLRLSLKGIEFIEEINNAKNVSFFSEKEKTEIEKRLDDFKNQLIRLEKAQEITYDDITDEINELKKLLTVLNKKNWKEVLKGKLIDIGLGSLSEEVISVIVNTFKDQHLLN